MLKSPAMKSQKGFSIIEVSIAMGLISLLAYSVMSFFPAMKSAELGTRAANSCRQYLETSFNSISKYGILGATDKSLIPSLSSANPYSNSPNYPNLGIPVSTSPDITNQQLFPLYNQALISWVDSNTLTTFRTAGMIDGAVPVVNALYNNLTNVCSSGYTYTSLTSTTLFPQPPTDFQPDTTNATNKFNFSLKVQIVPYDWRTHATIACGTSGSEVGTFIPAPLGVAPGTATNKIESSPTGAFAAGSYNVYFPKTAGVPDIRNTLAFQVSLTASHDENGRAYKCSETRVFGYPSYLVRPAAPDATTFTYSGVSKANWGPDTVNMTVGYLANVATAGSILLCRDQSTSLGYTTPSGSAFYNTILKPDPMTHQAWVPCERVTACGKMQDYGAYNSNASVYPNYTTTSDNTAFTLHMRWTNSGSVSAGTNRGLPYNCHVSIQVKAVDPAGNVSAATTTLAGNITYVGF